MDFIELIYFLAYYIHLRDFRVRIAGGFGVFNPPILFLTPQFTFSTAPRGVGRNPHYLLYL